MNSDETKNHQITIYDVAKEAGVSYSTVSRVLNGFEFVKEATRSKVMDAAERLGYVANLQARSLAGGRSQVIGLVVPSLDNGYIGEVARGVDQELARANYDLMLYTTHRNLGKESRYVRSVSNGLCDGLLLIVPLSSANYIEALQNEQFPYVLIDQTDTSNRSSVIDSTNWQGAYDATKYLIELGHERIAFITGLMELSSAVDRLAGYEAALRDHDMPIIDELIVEGNFWENKAYELTKQLLTLPSTPTAIFAANDLSAFGAMEAIREAGLSIPNDISLIGFDDIPQALWVHPKLTTVRQPLDQMGRVAVRLLLERIENPDRPPRRMTLATQLIIRDSCLPPKEKRG